MKRTNKLPEARPCWTCRETFTTTKQLVYCSDVCGKEGRFQEEYRALLAKYGKAVA